MILKLTHGFMTVSLQPSRENAALAMVCLVPAVAKVGGAFEKQVRAALNQWTTRVDEEEEEEYVADYMSEALERLG